MDTLQVHSEEDILHSMLRWVKHDEENRKIHLPVLVSRCLRIQLLYKDSVKNLTEMYPDIHSLGVIPLIQDKERDQIGGRERPRGVTSLLMCAGGDTRVMQ